MRIESKFLTADVRLTGARFENRKLVTEGLLKEFMPVVVEMEAADMRLMARLLLAAFGANLEARLPQPVRRLLVRARSLRPRRGSAGVPTNEPAPGPHGAGPVSPR